MLHQSLFKKREHPLHRSRQMFNLVQEPDILKLSNPFKFSIEKSVFKCKEWEMSGGDEVSHKRKAERKLQPSFFISN